MRVPFGLMTTGCGYHIPRKDVRLVGIPFIWNTNLEDQDIVSLYSLIADDPEVSAPSARVEVGGMMSVALRLRDKLVEFKEGACHCVGFGDTIYAAYKTTQGWGIWAAGQTQVQELEDEQELEDKVEQELLQAEDCHLASKCIEARNGRDYETAFKWLCARADLLRNDENRPYHKNRYGHFMLDEVFWWFSDVPAHYCIEFLRRYTAPTRPIWRW